MLRWFAFENGDMADRGKYRGSQFILSKNQVMEAEKSIVAEACALHRILPEGLASGCPQPRRRLIGQAEKGAGSAWHTYTLPASSLSSSPRF